MAISRLDGHQFIQTIRQILHLKYTPGIAISGYNTSADQKKTKPAGFNFHVGKPISHGEFIDVIEEHTSESPSE